MSAGVYSITSRTSGNAYIGSAKDIEKRWARHVRELRAGCHHSSQLTRVVARRGFGDLEFKVLLVCVPEHVLMYEQILLDAIKPRYNSAKLVGKVDHTPEVRSKLSAAVKSRWANPERREKNTQSIRRYARSDEGREQAARRAERQWADASYRKKLTEAHRARCRTYEAFGRLWSLKEAAEQYDIAYTVVKNRIQLGWTLERALTTPKRGT